jgi:DHA1 family tetracycline resistance protein-like MFS transporter
MANRPRTLTLLFAILLVDGVIGSLLYPILPEFTSATSQPTLWFGFAALLFALLQFLAAPVLGRLSDERGRQPVFRLAAVGTLVAMVLALPLRLRPFLANRVVDGTTNGLYAVVKSAIVDVSPATAVQRNLGLSATLTYAGFIVGPAIAALVLWAAELGDLPGPQALVAAGIVFAVANVVLSIVLPETAPVASPGRIDIVATVASASPRALARQLAGLRRRAPIVARLVATEAWVYLGIGYYNYFVIFAAVGPLQMDAQAISLLFVYFAGLGIVTNTVFFGRVVHRLPAGPILTLLLVAGAALMLSYGYGGPSLVVLYLVVAVDMVTVAFIPGIIEGRIGQEADETERGEVFGLSQGINSLMTVVSTLAYTALAEVDVRLPWIFFGVCLGVAAYVSQEPRRVIDLRDTTAARDTTAPRHTAAPPAPSYAESITETYREQPIPAQRILQR